ncbi:MAG: MarR family transcriptional regulator [Cellulosilyticum sp.]|nr:MarR family transcriptional regulator [Cellulosilyticum sp.]
MIAENLETLTNYLWHESTKKINTLLIHETDFNISDYYYLTAISNMEHPNFGDVAHALNLTKPAVSALIKRLIHHELIEKIQCEEDKRIFYLSITQKGKEMINGDSNLYARLESLISHSVNPDELQALDHLLNKIVSLISKEYSA